MKEKMLIKLDKERLIQKNDMHKRTITKMTEDLADKQNTLQMEPTEEVKKDNIKTKTVEKKPDAPWPNADRPNP